MLATTLMNCLRGGNCVEVTEELEDRLPSLPEMRCQ